MIIFKIINKQTERGYLLMVYSKEIDSYWRKIDQQYAYDGELGAVIQEDGGVRTTVWAPTADQVDLVIYDAADQNIQLAEIPLTKGDKGEWTGIILPQTLNLDSLVGYYYQYKIHRGDEIHLTLDPYAKSMAEWVYNGAPDAIGKGAFVNPDRIGTHLDYAEISGYKKREDAIIYEVHVRDFTSDPYLDGLLDHRFGTFKAFIERLDYIQSLGVTHIQLLPIMSYLKIDESRAGERIDDYRSANVNYNWGYDPQSYFSLTGMYSEDATDPHLRIAEFKALVAAIHERGMGVILDVVYNHTGSTYIFESIEPGYYNFADKEGDLLDAFGGGAFDSRRYMARRLLIDSIVYWTDTFKVDGFRFDMMGDLDLETVQEAYNQAGKLNPNMLFIGEGWRSYKGPNDVIAADQDAMIYTDNVASFSDEFRNYLKSGYPEEGAPYFLSGGAQPIDKIFQNIIGQPSNFKADSPGDVVQYLEAHDNLTAHDVISQAIQIDPVVSPESVHRRLRLGALLVLTAQGIAFIHAGQEYGRTKQFRHHDYQHPVVNTDTVPYKSTYMTNKEEKPFEYPYFIHDSYNASDAVNKFEWAKATDQVAYPIHVQTQAYTRGLIHLRRQVDAFRYDSHEAIAENVWQIQSPSIDDVDLVIAYGARDTDGNQYLVVVNTDEQEREIILPETNRFFLNGTVLVDGRTAGTQPIAEPVDIRFTDQSLVLAPLTGSVIQYIK